MIVIIIDNFIDWSFLILVFFFVIEVLIYEFFRVGNSLHSQLLGDFKNLFNSLKLFKIEFKGGKLYPRLR